LEVNRRLKDFPDLRQTALAAASFALELSREEGGSPLVVTAVVLLKEIALATQPGGGTVAGDSLAAAREIMAVLDLPPEVGDEVVEILEALLADRATGRLNERLARDALRLAGWKEEIKGKTEAEVSVLAETFLSAAGRKQALLLASRRIPNRGSVHF
ncbi:MAG: hypothetical protein QME13_02095, partial [Thermoanaerobacteraceae bacterium]|nr:hypothetical protein [Thermoanaerobacteraceae bacterium]